LKTKAYTGGDEQLWKVVTNGDGIALVNKLGGKYMDVDYAMNRESVTTPGSYRSSKICVTVNMPTNALRFLESTAYSYTLPFPDWTAESKAVFIIDNSVTTVSDNKLTFKTTGGAPFSFAFTSLGTPNFCPYNIPGWGDGNPNQLVQFRTQEEMATDLKVVLAASIAKATTALGNATVGENIGDIKPELKTRLQAVIDNAQAAHDGAGSTLADINLAMEKLNSLFGLFQNIEKANTLLKNTSIGYNPGQFTQETVDGLVSTVEYAQEVVIDVDSDLDEIADMNTELLTIINSFTSQVNLPEISSSVDHWYYIQGTRPENSYLTAGAAGAATQVKGLPVIPDETQLWRLVPNGEGFAMQNKATSEYLQTDFPTGTNLSTQAEMPVLPLMFKGSSETSNNTLRFLIENLTGMTPAYRLHAGGSGNGWGLMNWTGNATDHCSWLLLSEDELYRAEVSLALAAAKAVYSASVEGLEFGQFSAETRSTLNDLIVATEAYDLSAMSQEELTAAKVALNDAVVAFECNKDVSTLSSITQKKWFRLVNNMQPQTGYAGNKAMSSNTREVDQKYTFEVINNESAAQLFRFELNIDKTIAVAIINKANDMYVGPEGKILSENPGATFEITSLDGVSFWIKPTGYAPLHAASYGTEIVNWDAGAGSASAWRFQYVMSEDITDFVTPYIQALTNEREKYNASVAYQGTSIGKYTVASMEAYNAIISAEEAKDPASMTNEQLIAGMQTLAVANEVLVVNTDITTLVTADPAVSTNWYRLISAQSASGYASGKAMSSNGRLTEEPFTWEEKDEYSTYQLFSFELNADKTKVLSIYNKGSESFIDPTGKLAAESTVENEFEIVQLDGGRSFWIHPTLEVLEEGSDPEVFVRLAPLHAASADSHIVNWESGVGSASAWYFEHASTEFVNALESLDNSNYKVRVNEGIVTIDGVENFEVYSTTGQRQNHKAALKSGVYVIRVDNMTKKLVIK
jgi:hypothetical protein